MSRRTEFTRKVMAEAFRRSQGRCEKCTAKLGPGNREYDHIVPCELGGEATLDNCMALCRACHRAKTANDVRAIRKSDRQRDRHNGTFRGKSRPLGRGNHQHTATRALTKRVGHFEDQP